MRFPVLLDTCVLYGYALSDLLLRLAEMNTYRPLWSDDILDELERNLIKQKVASPEGARKRIHAMKDSFEDATVTGYRDLEAVLQCDPKDRHVLAAAIRANAALLVTFNLKDFPSRSTDDFDVEVVHPDDFLLNQLGLFESIVAREIINQAADYNNPATTPQELLAILAKSGVPRFAEEVRKILQL